MMMEINPINPLLIPKILHQVLDNLSPHHLKTCRLVSPLWNNESLSILRHEDHILFNSLKDISRFVNCYSDFDFNLDLDSSSAYRYSYKNQFPYEKCIIGSSLLDPSDPEFFKFSEASCQFFQKFGPFLTKVHLNMNTDSSRHSLLPLKSLLSSLLVKQLPNLETLSILIKGGSSESLFETEDEIILPKIRHFYITCSGYDKKQQDLKPLICSFLKSFVNLETISCRINPLSKSRSSDYFSLSGGLRVDDNSNSKLVEALLNGILYCGENELKSMSKLEILLPLNSQMMESFEKTLSSKSLKSLYLKLQLDCSVESETETITFLKTFKKSLATLYLEFPPNSNCTVSLNLKLRSSMNCLKKLTLSNYNGSLEFLRFCPVIKILNINHRRSLYFLEMLIQNETLSALSISWKCICDGDDEVMSTLGRTLKGICPSLTTLHLDNVGNQTLRGVFQHLPNLIRLAINGDEISDEGICGETKELIVILWDSAQDQNSKGFLEFRPRFPSILDLKKLQHLSIQAKQISDASLGLVISKCEHLRSLKLNSKLELITMDGFKRLVSLQNLENLKVFVRKFGWKKLKDLQTITNNK